MKSITFTGDSLPEGGELQGVWNGGDLSDSSIRFGVRLAGLAGARLDVEPRKDGGMLRMTFRGAFL
jgi:hypothetical protein